MKPKRPNQTPRRTGEKRSKALFRFLLEATQPISFLSSGLVSRPTHASHLLPSPGHRRRTKPRPSAKMTTGYIVGSLVGSFAIAYLCDTFVSDKKAFGGSTPKTVSEKEWWQATDTKFQAWPRTAGPPVIMNPISRQNFIVKSTE